VENINTVIWACGYGYDASIFQFPVLDSYGIPDAPRGASNAYPGLYFIGFPFVPTLSSGFITGVRKCALYITEKIEERRVHIQPS
jgi:putative flavoprotein involved in K+ transport